MFLVYIYIYIYCSCTLVYITLWLFNAQMGTNRSRLWVRLSLTWLRSCGQPLKLSTSTTTGRSPRRRNTVSGIRKVCCWEHLWNSLRNNFSLNFTGSKLHFWAHSVRIAYFTRLLAKRCLDQNGNYTKHQALRPKQVGWIASFDTSLETQERNKHQTSTFDMQFIVNLKEGASFNVSQLCRIELPKMKHRLKGMSPTH